MSEQYVLISFNQMQNYIRLLWLFLNITGTVLNQHLVHDIKI